MEENKVYFNDPMFGFFEDRKTLTELSQHLINKFSGDNKIVFFAAGEKKIINMITVYKIRKESLRIKYPLLVNLSHSIQYPFDLLFDVYFYYNLDGNIAPIDIYNFNNNDSAQRRAESYYNQFEASFSLDSYKNRIWNIIKNHPNNGLIQNKTKDETIK
jgi:hypothetical protein